MSRGIVYINFGVDCDEMLAHTAFYSRQFTDLPFCVLTNIKQEDRSGKWQEVKNIQFVYINDSIEQNRHYKTSIDLYSAFDENIYLDCDSVIQNYGIEKVFDHIDSNTIAVNSYLRWEDGDKIIKLYKKTMDRLDVKLPLTVYNGAFLCFRKSPEVRLFFNIWNEYWKEMGQGREMPSLACAIKNSGIKMHCLEKGIFEPSAYDKNSIVQHNYETKGEDDFFSRFNVPYKQLDKHFDSDPTDWRWV